MIILAEDIVPNIWRGSVRGKVLRSLVKDMSGGARILYQQVDITSSHSIEEDFIYDILILTTKSVITINLLVPAHDKVGPGQKEPEDLHIASATLTRLNINSLSWVGESTQEDKITRYAEVAPYLRAGLHAEGLSPFDLGSSGWTDLKAEDQSRICWGSLRNAFRAVTS